MPDGTLKYRLVIDARPVNVVTLGEAYIAPTVEESISAMYGAKSYNLKQAYHSIHLTEKAKQLTAFGTPFGQFHFNYCCFGFKNSGATLCRLLTKIFSDMIGKSVQIYCDDILIYTLSIENHIDITNEVLSRLDNAKFKY